MKDPLGVSPSKGNQGTTRGKEKIILTSVGIEPTRHNINIYFRARSLIGNQIFVHAINRKGETADFGLK